MTSYLPVLTFHALDDGPSAISFSPRVFRRGIAKLNKNGYRSLTLMEAVNLMRQGKSFPDRSFVITFDDGYQTVYVEAFPILREYHVSATVFLTVGQRSKLKPTDRLPSLNERTMLNWQEIREMHGWGIDFGSHTLTHPDLTRLPFERAKGEICESKEIIEHSLSAPVDCFAYPYGRYNIPVRELIKKHYSCACSDGLGLLSNDSDTYAIKRIDAYYLQTDRLFDLMFTRFFPLYIGMRNIPREIGRAIRAKLGQ